MPTTSSDSQLSTEKTTIITAQKTKVKYNVTLIGGEEVDKIPMQRLLTQTSINFWGADHKTFKLPNITPEVTLQFQTVDECASYRALDFRYQFSKQHVIALCFNPADRQSFKDIQSYYIQLTPESSESPESPEKHDASSHPKKNKPLFLLLEIHLNSLSERVITQMEGKDLAKKLGIEFFCLDSKNILSEFNNIAKYIYYKREGITPISSAEAKPELEERGCCRLM